MPNKTYELRKLYFEQGQYSAKQIEPEYPSLLRWPEKGYFEKFKLDAELLQKTLSPIEKTANYSIADQVFGNQKESEYLGLKHLANLFYERCKLHKQHLEEIEHSHIKTQEDLFGVKINNIPENARRLSSLEGLLLQLEQQRRDEELAFWKDTVELREKLFEGASTYKDAKHRYSVFADVETDYGR
ncbi:MAG: hypothetical protein JXB29_00010 [Sedimentisphaerales bacterium]|nr:hypothetical protein [Sedimentisphaerales bacterium]